jgi:predicted permease
MTILYRLRAFLRWLFRREEIERALDSDLEDYIERSTAEKMRAGMSESEARRAARIELGGVEQTKDRVRSTFALGPIDTVMADARYALRTMRRQKTFTAVVVLTLALGIGANVAIFSVAEQILLRPLPVTEPERLVNLSDAGPKTGSRLTAITQAGWVDSVFSYPMFRDLDRAQEPFVGIAAHRIFDASLSAGEQARPDAGLRVSGGYFSLLGLRPALGRLLGPQDDRVNGQAESVVLSYSYWQSEFGSNPGAVGQALIVNGTPLTIVGVAPPGFYGTTVGVRANVFVPITFPGIATSNPIPNFDDRNSYWVHLFARLKPEFALDQAEAAINPLYRSILNEVEAPLVSLAGVNEQELEAFRAKSLVLEPGAHGQSRVIAPARDGLEMLFAVSGIVLLLCCANVAGLMLVRSSARGGEMAVRASMGATRGRLASLLLVESSLLALPSAILSLPVAAACLPVALATLGGMAGALPGLAGTELDLSLSFVAAFVAIGIAVLSTLIFGIFPVRDVMRTEPGSTLQAHGTRQTSSKRVTRFRAGLATCQIALSMALLALTGVFTQSLANLAQVDLGLDVDSVVMFSVSPETSGYSPESSATLYEELEDELAAIPGVSSTASSTDALLAGGSARRFVGFAVGDAVAEGLPFNQVSDGFFRTLGVAFLAGRDFRDTDAAGASEEAIVNRRFAELFLDGDAIGRRIGARESIEIVGVVADFRHGSVAADIEPHVFLPRRQSPSTMAGSATFYARGARAPEDLMNAVRETVARVGPTVPVMNLRTMEQQVRENLSMERFVAGASMAFALLATVLAGLGLYGVLSYSVAQQSREIGLRFALGAPAHRIRGLVFRQVVIMVVVGAAIGAGSAVMLGRAARSLLFGVEAGNPLALAAAAVVLAAVTFGAAYFPARRASRVDPMTVLRYE